MTFILGDFTFSYINTKILMWITSLNLRNKGEAPRLELVNIPVPAQRRTFDITLYCKQACTKF